MVINGPNCSLLKTQLGAPFTSPGVVIPSLYHIIIIVATPPARYVITLWEKCNVLPAYVIAFHYTQLDVYSLDEQVLVAIGSECPPSTTAKVFLNTKWHNKCPSATLICTYIFII